VLVCALGDLLALELCTHAGTMRVHHPLGARHHLHRDLLLLLVMLSRTQPCVLQLLLQQGLLVQMVLVLRCMLLVWVVVSSGVHDCGREARATEDS
jgi:hypothetical protein